MTPRQLRKVGLLLACFGGITAIAGGIVMALTPALIVGLCLAVSGLAEGLVGALLLLRRRQEA